MWGAMIKQKEQQSNKMKKSRLDNLPSLQIEISRDSSNCSDSDTWLTPVGIVGIGGMMKAVEESWRTSLVDWAKRPWHVYFNIPTLPPLVCTDFADVFFSPLSRNQLWERYLDQERADCFFSFVISKTGQWMSPSRFIFLQKKIIWLYLTQIEGPFLIYSDAPGWQKQSCDLMYWLEAMWSDVWWQYIFFKSCQCGRFLFMLHY